MIMCVVFPRTTNTLLLYNIICRVIKYNNDCRFFYEVAAGRQVVCTEMLLY